MTFRRRTLLSPSLCRFTFGGAEVAGMRTCAPDQRIKLFFPDAAGHPPALSRDTWLTDYQAMSPADRLPRRTYTIRALRTEAGEVDIDFVLHGSTGPASRWALGAAPGDRLQIVAPDKSFDSDPGGYEWRPPPAMDRLLLLVDETALPAVAGILEELAATATPTVTQLYLEVPTTRDRLAVPALPSLRLCWSVREVTGRAPGSFLVDAARNADVPHTALSPAGALELSEVDVDRSILWETQTPPKDDHFYAWVAGEAGAVKAIRQILIKERAMSRTATNLMGYWRLGRVLE
ncbi:MAG: siderophore-interacting protein [Rhizomicrobium sp.]